MTMAENKSPSKKKTKGTYHHGDLKRELKEAALQLVLEKGARGFSINEASRLAGVTVGAPYRHFEDKDALLAEVATEGFQKLALEVRGAADANHTPGERLRSAGLAYLRFAREHRGFFEVMFGAGLKKAKYMDLAQASREAFDTILSLTMEMEREEQRALDHAVTCWALVHGLATLNADGAFAPDGGDIHIDAPSLLTEFVKSFSAGRTDTP